jgi:hypothetical protein
LQFEHLDLKKSIYYLLRGNPGHALPKMAFNNYMIEGLRLEQGGDDEAGG